MLRLVPEGCAFMGTLDDDVKRCTRASCGDIGSQPGRTKAGDIFVASESDVLAVEEELGEIKMRGNCDMTLDKTATNENMYRGSTRCCEVS
jgi:hypothetical protein